MISNTTNTNLLPRFEISDSESTRSDLATRKEIKFTYVNADVSKLRSLLAMNCRRLVHNNPVSVVRSIYFDDASLSACHANLDGIGRRRKVRLRWYDSLQPGTEFYFEIKWRENRVTGKHRLQLASQDPLHQLSYKQIVDGLHEALPEQHMGDLLQFCEPVMIVEYNREHFASDDGCLRVTLDYDVRYYDQSGRHAVSTAFARRLEGLVVLEGKTPLGREAELRRLFYPFAARMGRCSKYVHGCRLLGLIHDSSLA